MGKIFDFEGPVATFLSRVVDLVWLNIIFVICSIPVFTIGASTTAMYYVTLKMAKNEEGYITKSFFKSFKENFKQATGIWLIVMLVMGVLIADAKIVIGGSLDEMISSKLLINAFLVIIGIVGVVILIIFLYVFPLLARFDNTIKNTIKNAFLIGVRHLPYTVAIFVICIIPTVIMYFSNMALILVMIEFSLVAYANSFLFNRIFVKYEPQKVQDNSGADTDSIVDNKEEEIAD